MSYLKIVSYICVMVGGLRGAVGIALAISVDNYHEVKNLDGAYYADYAVSKMAHHMVRLRRQSDIIGQTGVNEYSILLQRTENTKEALDAANRFAATFDEIEDIDFDDHDDADADELDMKRQQIEESLSKSAEDRKKKKYTVDDDEPEDPDNIALAQARALLLTQNPQRPAPRCARACD